MQQRCGVPSDSCARQWPSRRSITIVGAACIQHPSSAVATAGIMNHRRFLAVNDIVTRRKGDGRLWRLKNWWTGREHSGERRRLRQPRRLRKTQSSLLSQEEWGWLPGPWGCRVSYRLCGMSVYQRTSRVLERYLITLLICLQRLGSKAMS